MAKEISQEMFDILTSTIWQDFKGYKRDLQWESLSFGEILWILFVIAIQIGCAIGAVDLFCEGDIGILFSAFPAVISVGIIWLLYSVLKPRYHMSKVNKVAYDIELSSTNSKIIRTKKHKYGIVQEEISEKNGDVIGLFFILSPKYNMIQRTDVDSFIIAKKQSFSSKCYYGIYNSSLREITVPIRYDKITRPNNNANLYVAELNGQKEKFNSMGDRILL